MIKAPWYIKIFRALFVILIIFLIVVSLYPLFWMVITSFKTYTESVTWPPSLLPNEWIWDNYYLVFTTPGFFRFFFNSTVYSVIGTILAVLLSAMAGYAFAKFQFKGRHILFMVVLSTMMIPGQVTLIPVFLITNAFGWVNTYMGLIVPGLAGAFGIFLIRQFAMGVPNDFFEAARIDGSGEIRAFFTIFLPLIKPALTTLIVLDFMARWNDLFWPLIIVTSSDMRPLQLALTSLFRTIYDTRWAELCAALTIAALPTIVLYIIFQKYFTQGIVLTSGIKG